MPSSMVLNKSQKANPWLEVKDTFTRTFRVMPTFLILAVFGAAAAYLLHVPRSERVVAGTVPFMVFFLISRAVILVLPPPPTQEQMQKVKRPDTGLICLFSVVFGAAFIALDLVFSSAVFALLRLPDLTNTALDLAMKSGMVSSLALVIFIFSVLQHIGIDLSDLLIGGLWKVVMYPSIVADRIFMPHQWHKRAV